MQRVIKNPMDFGTINSKLHKGNYKSFEGSANHNKIQNSKKKKKKKDFVSDVRQVFSNCRTFNPPTSEVCVAANHVEKIFEQKLSKAYKEVISATF